MSKFKEKGPSPSEIARVQSQAAKAEREKIAQEQSALAAKEKSDLEAAFADKQSKRRAFTAGIGEQEDETNRRKFLKGV